MNVVQKQNHGLNGTTNKEESLMNLNKEKNKMLTVEHMEKILAGNKSATDWYFALDKFFVTYDINTKERIAAFLAQCVHESGGFKFLSENLNYGWQGLRKVFPNYFPTDELAKQYERQPEKIANKVYSNRMGNGPESSGEGWKYRGRGIIQLTGKNNYTNFAKAIDKPLEEVVDYLATFDGAIHSACWFWNKNNLNDLADSKNMKELTRRINGGYNGLEDRIKHYNHILHILES